MTECSKKVIEVKVKFYSCQEDLDRDKYVFLTIEVEGATYPGSLIKTVVQDKSLIIPIGDEMAYVGPCNLRSARFQLIRVKRFVPVDVECFEDVYMFESFID